MSQEHESFMLRALDEARKAIGSRDRPIGAVVVRDGEVVGRARSTANSSGDPTAHAEVMAIRDAAANLKTPELKGSALYTTAASCPMCVGAMLFANIDKLIVGAGFEFLLRILGGSPRSYTVEGLVELMGMKLEVIHGVLQEEAEMVLRQYRPPAP